ncbi:hypothetical protein CsSME_00008441 [Camellia sinensis var. sinensis]
MLRAPPRTLRWLLQLLWWPPSVPKSRRRWGPRESRLAL